MPKLNSNDKGLKPVKLDASNTMDIKKVCSEKQLMENPSDTLEKVSALEKTPIVIKPKSGSVNENSNDSELNHVGKSVDFSVNPIKPDSNGVDLNHVGQIAETNLSKELDLQF